MRNILSFYSFYLLNNMQIGCGLPSVFPSHCYLSASDSFILLPGTSSPQHFVYHAQLLSQFSVEINQSINRISFTNAAIHSRESMVNTGPLA